MPEIDAVDTMGPSKSKNTLSQLRVNSRLRLRRRLA